MPVFRAVRLLVLSALVASLAGCATPEPEGPPRKETVLAVTDGGDLIRFNAGQPRRVLERRAVQGLAAGERLVGIDYRVARGVLYGLGDRGRLYTIDPATGQASPVGGEVAAPAADGRTGFDFNPAADRIRVVGESGSNARRHPDTGALVSADPALHYAPGDPAAGQAPRVTAAAYSYHPRDDKLTTNYAIDVARGTLVMQGSREGTLPVVSPNTGRLVTVGPLGTGPVDDAAFDIADVDNTALVALRQAGRTRLHVIDLATGRATPIGTLADGAPLRGLAIVP